MGKTTSATEELRQMLDERGVEWEDHSDDDVMHTTWNRADCWFTEFSDGWTALGMAKHGTPAKAIEATLGRETCHNIARSEDGWLCSKCGAHMYKTRIDRSYLDGDGKRWYTTDLQGIGLHYCPNCGREVEP